MFSRFFPTAEPARRLSFENSSNKTATFGLILFQNVQPAVPPAVPSASAIPTEPSNTTSSTLSPKDSEQAQKYCRFAASALQYEDVKTAIENLHKALALLEK